jgi:hypothetical protein
MENAMERTTELSREINDSLTWVGPVAGAGGVVLEYYRWPYAPYLSPKDLELVC